MTAATNRQQKLFASVRSINNSLSLCRFDWFYGDYEIVGIRETSPKKTAYAITYILDGKKVTKNVTPKTMLKNSI